MVQRCSELGGWNSEFVDFRQKRVKSLTITLIVKEVEVTVWPEFGGNALHNLSWVIF